MKITKLMALTLFVGSTAYAHEFPKYVRIQQAVEATHEAFLNDETGATIKTFLGSKAWVESTGLMSKVYLSGNKEITYTCSERDEHTPNGEVLIIECKKNQN